MFNKLKERFVGALNGDLNTSVAVTALYDVEGKCNDATKLAAIATCLIRCCPLESCCPQPRRCAGEADAGGRASAEPGDRRAGRRQN